MVIRRSIVSVDPTTLNVTEFCQQHGISTWFFWALRRRYEAEGEAALEPKSRAPHHVANRTSVEVEDAIVAKRKELVDAGLDAGADTIVWHLEGMVGLPSASTVMRILRRRGFVAPEPKKAPKHAHHRFTAERANDCWQLDDTAWQLADGSGVKILNVIDDHSRSLVGSRAAAPTVTGAFALQTLAVAAQVWGWPNRVLSDNAKAFRDVLGAALRVMGIGVGHSRPYHPQTCGKVERFHQTLKRWLANQPPAATIEELQAQLDTFAQIYNCERPHKGVDRRTPAAVWQAAPKNGPADQPLGEPTRVYNGVIGGGVFWAGTKCGIGVGMKHNGRRAITIITGHNCHVFADGQLIRQLELDPTRRYQPIRKHPGPTVSDVPLDV